MKRHNLNYFMNEIISELEQISAKTKENFGKFSAEQINWKPSAESWSIGQCFEHLILTNNQMLSAIEKVADGKHQNSFWENWSPFSGFLGGFLNKSMVSDGKKFKAPSQTIVPPSNIDAKIFEQFIENNQKVTTIFAKLAGVDLQKTVITSPFMSLMTYKLADGLKILVEHEKRHFRQAERVIKTEGFPK